MLATGLAIVALAALIFTLISIARPAWVPLWIPIILLCLLELARAVPLVR